MDESVEAVSQYHTHSIPLDMEDIERDWDKPVADAGIAGKASVIVRVGMLDLGSGTGSFRVREMMHRIAFPLGVHVRADVNLTDIEASCTDGKARVTEVVDLPSTGVNTERIWLLEHFADWFNIKLGESSVYHAKPAVSQELVEQLGNPTAGKSVLRAAAEAKARKASEAHEAHEA
ncbi:threonine/serine exporter family protein, partial [Bifidobacterium mongoliense]